MKNDLRPAEERFGAFYEDDPGPCSTKGCAKFANHEGDHLTATGRIVRSSSTKGRRLLPPG